MRILKPGGTFAVEIGWDQGAPVKALFEQAGFADVIVVEDLSDRDRAWSLTARTPARTPSKM